MNTAQINENSYLLDLSDPGFFDSPDRRRWYREAREPVFNEMNRTFWFDHFADQEFAQLAKTCKALGLPQSHNNPYAIAKPVLIATLVEYFQRLVTPDAYSK